MKTEIIKTSKDDQKGYFRSNLLRTKFHSSTRKMIQVPVFTSIEDEDYFFEVEDY